MSWDRRLPSSACGCAEREPILGVGGRRGAVPLGCPGPSGTLGIVLENTGSADLDGIRKNRLRRQSIGRHLNAVMLLLGIEFEARRRLHTLARLS